MSLKETLLQDMKTAMKEKDTVRKDVVQIVRAGVLQIEKDKKIVLDDEGILEVVFKELKKRNDVLPDYERSGREDAIKGIKRQIEILKNYLPQQLSENEIEQIVKEAIIEASANSPKDMGKVMKIITPKVKGKADTKLVSEMVKNSLNNL